MRTYNVGKITNSNDRKYFCGPGNDLRLRLRDDELCINNF